MDRRQVLKSVAALLVPSVDQAADSELRIAGQSVEVRIAPFSRYQGSSQRGPDRKSIDS